MSVVRFDRRGESGNIFYIIATASLALRLECRDSDANQMRTRVMMSKSYDEALEIIAEYVDLVEDA